MRNVTAVLGLAALAGVFTAACSDPNTSGPYEPAFAKSASGQEVCADYDSGKIDTEDDPNSVVVSAPSGFLISGYCVKAGTDVVFVVVDPPLATVEITAPNGKDVSHYALTYVPDEVGEWCSPGYWKNHSNDAEYAASFDDGNLLPANWRDILANPNVYGGAAFNNVASILSHLHPDVNFTLGDTINHSCPLSGPAN